MILVYTKKYIDDLRYLSGDIRDVNNVFGCVYEVKESEFSLFGLEYSDYIFELKQDLIKVVFSGVWLEPNSKNIKNKMDVLYDFSISGCVYHLIRSDKIIAFFEKTNLESFKVINFQRWNKMIDDRQIEIIENC